MKASRFTDVQKAFIIRQGEEGTPVAEICRKAGISQASYFNWKKKHAGMMPSEMKRLRELEEENNRLKGLLQTCRSTMMARTSPLVAILSLTQYCLDFQPCVRGSTAFVPPHQITESH